MAENLNLNQKTQEELVKKINDWRNGKIDVSVAGVTAKYSPEVRFSFADANSGKFAGVADCADGKVTVYANAVPAAVTISVIICTLMSV